MASELRKIHFFHTAQVMQSHLFRTIHSHHHGIRRIGSISMADAIGVLFLLPVTPFDESGQVASPEPGNAEHTVGMDNSDTF